jgi:hypothetical protein
MVWVTVVLVTMTAAAEEPIPAPVIVGDFPVDNSSTGVIPDEEIGADASPLNDADPCVHCSGPCSVGGPMGPLGRLWHHCLKPCLQDSHWGYAEYFCERPFGTLLRAHQQTQIFNGLTDQMVLYHYDFRDGPGTKTELNYRGLQQLSKLVEVAQQTGLPLVIEKTDNNSSLDKSRRQAVLTKLEQLQIPYASEMVVVAEIPAAGLNGEESSLIYQNLIQQTRDRGGSLGTERSLRRTSGLSAGSTGR